MIQVLTTDYVTLLGDLRDIIVPVQGFKIGKLLEDELNHNKKKVKIEFELPKGSYATLVMKSAKNFF